MWTTPEERAAAIRCSVDQYFSLARAPGTRWITSCWGTWRGGAANWRNWIAEGRPPATRAVVYVGDETIGAAVRAVVAKLPEAAAWFVVEHVVVIGVGVDLKGFCAARVPEGHRAEAQMVVLSSADPGHLAHELCHAWHRPERPALTREIREEILEYENTREAWEIELAVDAVSNNAVDDLLDYKLQGERAADGLASAWGFPVDTVTARRQRERARIYRRAEVAGNIRANLPERSDAMEGAALAAAATEGDDA